jgi:hypothetical protein
MVDELEGVLEELGGEVGVGRAVRTSEDLSAAIRKGFPHEAVTALTSTGLSLQEIASSPDLSLRSLQRRKSQGRLARYESGPALPPGAAGLSGGKLSRRP